MTEFNSLQLHDATLVKIEVLWEQATCQLFLRTSHQNNEGFVSSVLTFNSITALEIPKADPWGESVSVNSVEHSEGRFKISMQSGDTIVVTASSFSYAVF